MLKVESTCPRFIESLNVSTSTEHIQTTNWKRIKQISLKSAED